MVDERLQRWSPRHPVYLHDRFREVRVLVISTGVSLVLHPLGIRLLESIAIGFLLALSTDLALFFRRTWSMSPEQTRSIFMRWKASPALLMERTVALTFLSLGLISFCVKDLQGSYSILPLKIRIFIYISSLFAIWLQMQNGFSVHYAQIYYNLNPDVASHQPCQKGLIFAGERQPQFSDFIYVAYAVSLSNSISDPQLEDPGVRKVITIHAVFSFLFYSTAVSALLNLIKA
jgi:uncharacterized membrane protein